MLNCIYKFHPVGQGCFFSARIQDDKSQLLNVVYDCGSVTAGKHLSIEVENYYKSLEKIDGKRIVDLVILSHFDEDHISGVFELLKNVKCLNLVVPYLSIYERITLFSKGGSKSEWHKKFLQNPQVFIDQGEFDIDRVIILGQSPNGEISDSNQEIPLSPKGHRLVSDAEPLNFALDNIKLTGKFFYKTLPFTLKDSKTDFEFKFYIKELDPKLILDFKKEIKENFTFTNPNELLQDKHKLGLKGIYKSIFKNVNKTSLSVCIIKTNIKFIHYDDNPNQLFPYDKRIGNIILTGDSSIYTKSEIDEFKNYYKDELKEVLLFQIPHHGSKKNSYLDLSSGLWGFPIYVLNCGKGRKKHPNKHVLNFLNANRINCKMNNEIDEYKLSYEVR